MKDDFRELLASLKAHLRKTEQICQELELEKAGIDAEHWQTIYTIVQRLADALVSGDTMPQNDWRVQDSSGDDLAENVLEKKWSLPTPAPADRKKSPVDQFADVEYTIYLPVDGMSHQIIEYGKSLVENDYTSPMTALEDSAADSQKLADAGPPETTQAKPTATTIAKSSALPSKKMQPGSHFSQMPPPNANKKVKPLLPPNQRSLKKFKKQWVAQENAMQILGIDKAGLESLVRASQIECKIINNKKTYPLNELRIAHSKPKTSKKQADDSMVVLQQADAKLHEDLKHDQELRDLLSAASITPEYRYIQDNGGCFINDTANGNYNAINIMAIIVDRLGDSAYSHMVERLANLLVGKPELLDYTSEQVRQEIDSGSLFAFIEDDRDVIQMSKYLQNDNLLAKYYADLALFRLALLARSDTDLPDHLVSLAPKDIFELIKAVKWPPSEQEPSKREALNHYDSREKTVYILQRLCDNNPVEFDLKKTITVI